MPLPIVLLSLPPVVLAGCAASTNTDALASRSGRSTVSNSAALEQHASWHARRLAALKAELRASETARLAIEERDVEEDSVEEGSVEADSVP